MLLLRAAWVAALFVSVASAAAPPAALRADLDHTFLAHAAMTRAVAFSPDSRFLATASVDGAVKIWRLPDGKLVRSLSHDSGLTSLAFAPDGSLLAGGGYDGTVVLWPLAEKSPARTLKGHTGTVWTVAFAKDGRLASGGEDKTIRIWNPSDGATLRKLQGHSLNVWSVSFSPDGAALASGSFDHAVKVWRIETGALVRTLRGHTQAVVAVAFSPDGDTLASGGDDSAIRLWSARDGRLIRVLTGRSEHVYSVAFSPDGRWLASGGREKGALGTLWKQITGNRLRGRRRGTVRLWRVADGALQQVLAESWDDVASVAFSPDGKWLACGSEDRNVTLWRLRRAPVGRPRNVVRAARAARPSSYAAALIPRQASRAARRAASLHAPPYLFRPPACPSEDAGCAETAGRIPICAARTSGCRRTPPRGRPPA